MNTLESAQAKRETLILESVIEKDLDNLLALSAKTVGPEARNKLKALLAFYAKKPHPFTSCVRDNMKRFGPGRTEAVCATIKDLIEGNTKWRKGPRTANLSDELAPTIDNETLELLESMPADELQKVLLKMGELNE